MTKRIVSVLTTAAAMAGVITFSAAPANATVRGNCNETFCIAAEIWTNIGGKTVRVDDATVSVRDSLARNLNIFVADDHWNKPNSKSYKKVIGKSYPVGTLLCGSAVGASTWTCIKLKLS